MEQGALGGSAGLWERKQGALRGSEGLWEDAMVSGRKRVPERKQGSEGEVRGLERELTSLVRDAGL